MSYINSKDELIKKLRAREKWFRVDAGMNNFLSGAMEIVEDNVVIENRKVIIKPNLFAVLLDNLKKKGIVKAENITFMAPTQDGGKEYLVVAASTRRMTKDRKPMKGQKCNEETLTNFLSCDLGKVIVVKTKKGDFEKVKRYKGKSYLFCIADVDNPEKVRYALMGLANLDEGDMRKEYIRLFEKMGVAIGRQMGRVVERKKHEVELTKALGQLEKAVEQKDLMVSSFQHDMGNILSLVKYKIMLIYNVFSKTPSTDIDVVLKKYSDFNSSEIREILKEANLNIDGITDLTQEILSLVELIKSGTIEPQYINIKDVNEIIQPVVERVKNSAKDKGITIKMDIEKNKALYADPGLLKSAIDNLVRNAVKFCDEGDEICINIDSQRPPITIRVSDTGRGIESNRLEKLFDSESETSTLGTRDEKGKGKGLPNTKKFVEAHKGASLTVESRVGKGTTFLLHFPLRSESDNIEKELVSEGNLIELDFG